MSSDRTTPGVPGVATPGTTPVSSRPVEVPTFPPPSSNHVRPDPEIPTQQPSTPSEAAAAAARAVPGVARLYPGVFGEIATHLPGRRVPGVRTRTGPGGNATDVHVVAVLGGDLRALADDVHRAVHDAVGGEVNVVIEDVAC